MGLGDEANLEEWQSPNVSLTCLPRGKATSENICVHKEYTHSEQTDARRVAVELESPRQKAKRNFGGQTNSLFSCLEVPS